MHIFVNGFLWSQRYHLHTEDHRSQAQELEEWRPTSFALDLSTIRILETLENSGNLDFFEEFYVSPRSVFNAAMETLSWNTLRLRHTPSLCYHFVTFSRSTRATQPDRHRATPVLQTSRVAAAWMRTVLDDNWRCDFQCIESDWIRLHVTCDMMIWLDVWHNMIQHMILTCNINHKVFNGQVRLRHGLPGWRPSLRECYRRHQGGTQGDHIAEVKTAFRVSRYDIHL